MGYLGAVLTNAEMEVESHFQERSGKMRPFL